MATVDAELDLVQERLHDNAAIWTRAELLTFFNDGYREFLAKTRAVVRIHLMDVPPRYAMTYCYEWEARHTFGGPSRMMMLPNYDATKRVTSLWEAEQNEGVTPTASYAGKTQEWERAYGNETDRQFVFALPANHDLILRVAWDDKRLHPVTVREYDETDDAWFRQAGEPWWWMLGTNRVRSIEIYEIVTTYTQSYAFLDYAEHGFARSCTGTRTWGLDSEVYANNYAYTTNGDNQHQNLDATPHLTGLGWRVTMQPNAPNQSYCCTYQWEVDRHNGDTLTNSSTAQTYWWEELHGGAHLEFGVGTMRSIISPDRQYWALNSGAATNNVLGGIRDMRSSTDAVEVTHAVIPDRQLGEPDAPDLLPEQAHKYLRYYCWMRAFGRQGPGQNGALAEHYRGRFEMGTQKFRTLANQTHQDVVLVRESHDGGGRGTPPRVRLPSNYPAVW